MINNTGLFKYSINAAKKISTLTKDFDNVLCVGCTCDFFIKNCNIKYQNISWKISFLNDDLVNLNLYDLIFVYHIDFVEDICKLQEVAGDKVVYPEGDSYLNFAKSETTDNFILHSIGKIKSFDKGFIVSAEISETGYLLYGPYKPLATGEYRAVFEIVAPNMLALDNVPVCKISCETDCGKIMGEKVIFTHDLKYTNTFIVDFVVAENCVAEFKVLKYEGVRLGAKPVVLWQNIDLKHNKQRDFVPVILPVSDNIAKETEKYPIKIHSFLYNTPEPYLIDMINSVVNQCHNNWELYLYDTSSEDYKFIKKICEEFLKKDKRIFYKKINLFDNIDFNYNGCNVILSDRIILNNLALQRALSYFLENDNNAFYSDEIVFDKDIRYSVKGVFKPDFSVYNLYSGNYLGGFLFFKGKESLKGFSLYDIALKITESETSITHLQQPLYYTRINSLPNIATDKEALQNHLQRINKKATVYIDDKTANINTKFAVEYEPKVSIIIPNKNNFKYLKKCINSILNKTTYKNYEILIIENSSTEENILNYYKQLEKNNRIRVLYWSKPFNYAAINNFAVLESKGSFLLFLNNDTEVINNSWLYELLAYAAQNDIGAVGAKLLYGDGSLQHGGLGVKAERCLIGHIERFAPKGSKGYLNRLLNVGRVTAVTGACMMVEKSKFLSVGGFDEKFLLSYNDVDLCFKLDEKGYQTIFNPYASLYHYESVTRRKDKAVDESEQTSLFYLRWKHILDKQDSYFKITDIAGE